MKQFEKLMIMSMIVCSFFLTGCDMSKITEVIQKVTAGIQKALPAIQQAANAIGQIGNTINGNNTAANAPTQNNTSGAGAVIPTAGDQEDLANDTAGTTSIGSVQPLARPNGISQIRQTFGEPGTNQVTVKMACGPNGSVKRVTCNRKIAARLKAVFDEIKARGLSKYIHSFDGCYNKRKKRGGSAWSVHSWGIAVDINARENPMGRSRMTYGQSKLAEVFKKYGFHQLKNDPMHFQYCTGY